MRVGLHFGSPEQQEHLHSSPGGDEEGAEGRSYVKKKLKQKRGDRGTSTSGLHNQKREESEE